MKNSLTDDNNNDEFFATNFINNNNKRSSKKFHMIKIKKIIIKINNVEILIVFNSKAKINLISNVFVKKFKLISINVSSCETMILNHNQLKFYDIYFVRFKIKNVKNNNRFFNENFLKVDLNWSIILNLSWFQLSKIEMNWNINEIKLWHLSIDNILLTTNRIEKIEFEKLINDIVDDKKKIFVMFVRTYIDEKTKMQKIHIERKTQIDAILMKIKDKSNITTTIFDCLKKFEKIIDENKVYELSNHEFDDHAIDLKSNKKSFYDFIYSLFENELTILRIYLNKYLKNNFIKLFTFSIEIFILFVKKKNEIFRLCVNYKDLNLLIIKNRYSLSFIDESLNRLIKVRIYTSFDMIAIYNRLRIQENDEWKIAFKTRYEHFKYIVLFFDFINVFATFQNFVNKILTKRFDLCVIIYLNDIVIYFMNRKQHIENVKWMFQRLMKHKFFINNVKCKWFIDNIDFLNFVIFSKNVQMQKDKIDAIQKWSISKNVSKILDFLELCNFYRRFIKNFNKIVLSLISMLSESTKLHKKKQKWKRDRNKSKSRNQKSNIFLTQKIFETFLHLRQAFLKTSILQHFDSIKFIRVKIDVSNYVIEDILCQSNDEKHWHFVIYFSRKMISIECNYEVHDKKLLIIMFAFKQWRHYFENVKHQILVFTNHRNFNRFMSTTKLSFRQMKWTQKLFRYNFIIDYKFESKNFANDLSRRFDHMKIIEKKIENNRQILTQLRKSLQINSLKYHVCIDAIQATMQKSNSKKNINDFAKENFSNAFLFVQ